jgi:hypothetical protein
MLSKAIGQLLGIVKGIQESHWEMLKGYWIASEQPSRVL